jgi:hypothetical protein
VKLKKNAGLNNIRGFVKKIDIGSFTYILRVADVYTAVWKGVLYAPSPPPDFYALNSEISSIKSRGYA